MRCALAIALGRNNHGWLDGVKDYPSPGRRSRAASVIALTRRPAARIQTPMPVAMHVLTMMVAIFFAGMGLLAFASPERITATFGIDSLTAEGRNEVRAVYGGFGLAVAAMLALASATPLGTGIHVAVGVALLGMAGGRLVAALVERPAGFYPCWFYCALEAGMAGILMAAAAVPG